MICRIMSKAAENAAGVCRSIPTFFRAGSWPMGGPHGSHTGVGMAQQGGAGELATGPLPLVVRTLVRLPRVIVSH